VNTRRKEFTQADADALEATPEWQATWAVVVEAKRDLDAAEKRLKQAQEDVRRWREAHHYELREAMREWKQIVKARTRG
jgi:ribosomal protein S21